MRFSPLSTPTRTAVLAILVVFTSACNSGSSNPTTPSADSTFVGSLFLEGASPPGNCIADQFAADRGRLVPFSLKPPSPQFAEPGSFSMDGGGCPVTLVEGEGGELVLDVDAWCGWEIASWNYAAACGPAANAMLFEQIHAPVPVGRVLQGEGAIILSSPQGDISLSVSFALRD